MSRGRVLGALSIVAAAAVCTVLARRRHLRWGATDAEVREALPGDELLPRADLTATRAITVRAPAELVWPWIAQLGQGRGGFYTYDRLENLVGCDIHSAEDIVPEWQQIEVGHEVALAPDMNLAVAAVVPGQALVLHGGVPMGDRSSPYDFTWAFVLVEQPDGTTRLVVRERYAYDRSWVALLVEPVEAVSFLMSQKMLRGIRDRAERLAASSAASSHSRLNGG